MSSPPRSVTLADWEDFENAIHGLVGRLEPCVIKARAGHVAWDNDAYDFLKQDCPTATANPKLWRQGQLNSIQGLFEVADGIYQVRGFDLSNMTVVEGRTGGVIVIDPLISQECAAAALELYRKHRGEHRKVAGVIYSHSHADHFGGALGILPVDEEVPIIAPEGFMEEATSENVFAGPSMRRRAVSMYGTSLPKGPKGQIGCGLGMVASTGQDSLVPPTILVKSTGEEHVIDGVKIVFQMVPGTEAPVEMNFYFPAQRALCIAECATQCMHNIITLRGAQVRDAKAWSRYLDETIVLYGDGSDVLFGSHNWPTWGQEKLVKLIADQRDLYAYMHDQTVRMMNTGMTGTEIAEVMTLPPALQQAWPAQGFYGSLSHNVKGIYQKYMTWFDGNPAHLWQYPPKEEGERYVLCMGGVDQVVKAAETFSTKGDLRFAATLLGHAVAAQPDHAGARQALASVFEKLGFGAENATWRNFYLTGAQEMRSNQNPDWGIATMNTVSPGLSVEQWFAGLSVEIDGSRAAEENFELDVFVSDVGERWRLIVSNGALTYRKEAGQAGAGLTLTKAALQRVLEGAKDLGEADFKGDLTPMRKLLALKQS